MSRKVISIMLIAAMSSVLLMFLASASFISAHGDRAYPLPKDWRDIQKHDALHHQIRHSIDEIRRDFEKENRHTLSRFSAQDIAAFKRFAPHSSVAAAEGRTNGGGFGFTDPAPGPSSGPLCGPCFLFSDILLEGLSTSTGQQIIATGIEGILCAKLNSTGEKQLCEQLVPPLVKLVGALAGEATVGGWNLPRILCTDIAQSITQCQFDCCQAAFVPEQIHLSFATTAERMNYAGPTQDYTVSWATSGNTTGGNTVPVAEWRVVDPRTNQTIGNATNVTATQRPLVYSGFVGVLHGATLRGLPANSTVEYRVGGYVQLQAYFSPWIRFRTFASNIGTAQNPLRVGYIADMSVENSAGTISALTQLAQGGGIHALLFNGDISYADGDSSKFDNFMRVMQPIMSIIPTITSCGNHEKMWDNATEYRARVWNPLPLGAPADALYYNIRIGPVSFTTLDSETHIDTPNIDARQQAWADQVLQLANSVKAGFSFVQHHRPLYCSSGKSKNGQQDNSAECGFWGVVLREQIEYYYIKNGVDAVFSGHVHSYERTYPINDGQMMGNSYVFPPAPVYVIDGSAGNVEGQSGFVPQPPMWSAYRSSTVGYQVLTFQQTVRPEDGQLHTSMQSTFYDSASNAPLDSFDVVSKR